VQQVRVVQFNAIPLDMYYPGGYFDFRRPIWFIRRASRRKRKRSADFVRWCGRLTIPPAAFSLIWERFHAGMQWDSGINGA
jgi:hypothetical protein